MGLFSSALNDICLEVTLSELAILTSLFNLIDRLVFTAPVFPGSIDFSFFLVLVVFDVALIWFVITWRADLLMLVPLAGEAAGLFPEGLLSRDGKFPFLSILLRTFMDLCPGGNGIMMFTYK